jgi:hypothetical protein
MQSSQIKRTEADIPDHIIDFIHADILTSTHDQDDFEFEIHFIPADVVYLC